MPKILQISIKKSLYSAHCYNNTLYKSTFLQNNRCKLIIYIKMRLVTTKSMPVNYKNNSYRLASL